MKRLICQFLVASSLLLWGAGLRSPSRFGAHLRPRALVPEADYAFAATRPRYGSTLRVEMRARVSSLDPVQSSEDFAAGAAASKIRELVYDRLVRLDARGRPQPALALSWEHDARHTKWQFKLRPEVKWHDGSPLAPADVARVIEGITAARALRVVGDTLELEMADAWPEFPIALATGPEWVIRRKAADSPGGVAVGTGPFRVSEWKPGQRAVLEANEDYWGGRPYLDRIQIELGRSSRERLIDLELDKADLVELDPGEARRAQQEGHKVWTSAPVELMALDFDLAKPKVQDQRLRQAIALSIDRSAIQKVLLQNYGEVAGGIVPQWLSGYEFVFSTAMDLARARQLRADLGAPPPLKLGYDPDDTLAREVAERVAVNAREAGITLQVSALPQGWSRMLASGVDARVERSRIDAPALDEAFLQAARRLRLSDAKPGSPEEVYAAERRLLADFATVPLAHVPELVGLGSRVKNWSALRWSDWRLDEVWLESDKP